MTDRERLAEIESRLSTVEGKPWRYDPNHEMFVGSTNSLDWYYGNIDLGRSPKEYVKDSSGKYVLTEEAQKQTARMVALGRFLAQCREDMRALLEMVKEARGDR